MRGRLIRPSVAELARLDTVATAADPDGAGALTSGYDLEFREPVVRTVAGVRTDGRKESTPIFCKCQFESEAGSFAALQQAFTGNSPNSRIALVFHFKDLEAAGLVDATTGEAKIVVNARLVSIRKNDAARTLIQTIRTPPGLYAIEAKPESFGLGLERNLLVVVFEERALAVSMAQS